MPLLRQTLLRLRVTPRWRRSSPRRRLAPRIRMADAHITAVARSHARPPALRTHRHSAPSHGTHETHGRFWPTGVPRRSCTSSVRNRAAHWSLNTSHRAIKPLLFLWTSKEKSMPSPSQRSDQTFPTAHTGVSPLTPCYLHEACRAPKPASKNHNWRPCDVRRPHCGDRSTPRETTSTTLSASWRNARHPQARSRVPAALRITDPLRSHQMALRHDESDSETYAFESEIETLESIDERLPDESYIEVSADDMYPSR